MRFPLRFCPLIPRRPKQAAGSATPSLVSRILEEDGKNMSEDHLTWFAGGLCKLGVSPKKGILNMVCSTWTLSADSAAVDTSTTAILNFVLAMVLHPEAQKRSQDEINTVIGDERLPNAAEYVFLCNEHATEEFLSLYCQPGTSALR